MIYKKLIAFIDNKRNPMAPEAPLRVAIIGSGPSAFYAADFLQKQEQVPVEIDMFERLPTPFGLVRGGVAPDHPKIKSVTKVFDKTASHPNFRFYGNVMLGRDISRADLAMYYHAVIYAVGAQTDRRLNIPGEDLPGSHNATEFVGWYNGHPDYCGSEFDLSNERVAIVGNGNVAMDVARILTRTREELMATDIANCAIDELFNSRVKEIYLLGRRGPIQAKFTPPELKEFGELTDTTVEVVPNEIELDPLSQAYLAAGGDRAAEQNYQMLQQYSQNGHLPRTRKIVLRFMVSPVEIIGKRRVEAIKLVKNELYRRDDGSLSPRATDQYETIPVGLVFRSIGYQGVPLPGVPFDTSHNVIPNIEGRVVNTTGQHLAGEYAVGWIKRGPSGIIGTNKPDANETVGHLLEDVADGQMLKPLYPTREAIEGLLNKRAIDFVTYDDWRLLDRLEIENGEAIGRSRVKFTSVEDMMDALKTHRQAAARVLGH
jgi:ferredoxin--NADP+ reductase